MPPFVNFCIKWYNCYYIHHVVITGFETENKYRVRNAVGQQVYFAAESKTHLGIDIFTL